MIAYNEAIRYKVSDKKIFVLSMGTGSYIPDPSNPELTDSQMYNILGDRYQRWQILFEEPIRINDYNRIPYLLELGHQYIEELDASDANPINKLVESFENS